MIQDLALVGHVLRLVDMPLDTVFFAGFEAKTMQAPIQVIEYDALRKAPEGQGEETVCYGLRHRLLPRGEHLLISERTKEGCGLIATADWSQGCLFGECLEEETLPELLIAAYYSRLVREGALLLHASSVSYRGEGLVFVADSGGGKTTQAKLWNEYRSAEILNGDKVFLMRKGEEQFAYGSPWKGSSPYGVQAFAPIKAILAIEKGEENRVVRQTEPTASALILRHVFVPSWDEVCMEHFMNNLDGVLSTTAIYRLYGRPEEEAVRITEQTLWSGED